MRQQETLLSGPLISRTPTNPNVFSDDYSADSPATSLASNPRRSASISSIDSSSTLRFSHVPHGRPSTSRDEITADPFADDARSSLEDFARPSSIRKGHDVPNRYSSVTTASTVSTRSGSQVIPRAMSPYRGATGPSHPYTMYPQIGVGRSASVATTSTIRPVDAPLQGAMAPQHPYGMYQQNIDVEEDLGDQMIPLGFPRGGLLSHPRPSQADDVGDIVGLDGHLEHLPPYSRYPAGFRGPKIGRGPASIASVMREQEYAPDRDAPVESEISSATLVNRSSTRSSRRSEEQSILIPAENAVHEKSERRGQRKCCGTPVWLLALLGLGMLIGALIGGVIGGVLGERAAERRSAAKHSADVAAAAAAASSTAVPSVVTVTYTSDVAPLPTYPPNMPPLPTGRFQVVNTLRNSSKFCVAYSSYTPSWSCQQGRSLNVEVGGSGTNSWVSIDGPVIDRSFTYGAQAPILPSPSQSLHAFTDKEDPSWGPALFFASLFTKLVIVPENAFPTSGPSKRAPQPADVLTPDWVNKQAQQAQPTGQPGQRPWFCYWNQTAIEFFLYVNQTEPVSTATPTTTTGHSTMTGDPTSTKLQLPRALDVRGTSLPNYPRRIKIEEKRAIPGAPQPYCVQMQVMDDNTVVGPINNNKIMLTELPPTSSHKRGVLEERDVVDSLCYCEWLAD
jgi:hypothetical protein